MPIDPMGVLALQRALTQAADLLDTVTADDLGRPTPCTEWDVRRLANHLLGTTRVFVTMLQGSPPGWQAPEDYAEQVGEEMRTRGNALVNLWREIGDQTDVDPDWQAAEVATHTWDLAAALGRATDGLDQAVAQRALVTMDRLLGPTRKGRAFAPVLSAPAGSDAYVHLAAYAGRDVTAWSASTDPAAD